MTPTIHKVLLHGDDIFRSFIVPIGCLSEEPQEARNKDLRVFRQFLARKCSREKNLEDILKRFVVTSDPLLSAKKWEKHKYIAASSDTDISKILNEEGSKTLSQELNENYSTSSDEDCDF